VPAASGSWDRRSKDAKHEHGLGLNGKEYGAFSIVFREARSSRSSCTGLEYFGVPKERRVDLPNPRACTAFNEADRRNGIVIGSVPFVLGVEAFGTANLRVNSNGRSEWLWSGATLSLALAGLYDELPSFACCHEIKCEYCALQVAAGFP